MSNPNQNRIMDHDYFRRQLDLSSEMEMLINLLAGDRCPLSPGDEKNAVVTFSKDVSPVIQKGPMCGLVGLTMATQLLQKMKKKAPPHITDKLHPKCILDYAIRNGLSKQGEVFSSVAMEKLAVEHLCLRARTIAMESHDAICDLLVAVVSGQGAVLVPYDADKDHSPCLSQGHRAHWCLLVGMCLVLEEESEGTGTTLFASLAPSLHRCCQLSPTGTSHYILHETDTAGDFTELFRKATQSQTMREILDKDQVHVFARHGKSSHLGLWSLRDLLESNGNLLEVDPQRSNPLEYVIPDGGLKEGIQNKIIILSSN